MIDGKMISVEKQGAARSWTQVYGSYQGATGQLQQDGPLLPQLPHCSLTAASTGENTARYLPFEWAVPDVNSTVQGDKRTPTI